jgi:hypothetical protein
LEEEMTSLIMPQTGTRIPPLQKANVGPYVRAEYDKSIYTWGIPNNLIRTMAWLPRLAETEVDYANSFIFDVNTYADWPSPDDPTASVLYPLAGFVDRVTKELVINIVSLLNRSRYSITHHSVIGFNTLAAGLPPQNANDRKNLAEAMMLHLVDASGAPDFENKSAPDGGPLYTTFQLLALRYALAIHRDAHSVTNEQFNELTAEATKIAQSQLAAGPLAGVAKSAKFVESYVRGMLVELSWCICHFNGLLNPWFTVLRVFDEVDKVEDEIDFVGVYNSVLPDSIKDRNNGLLAPNGWGG